MKTCTTCGLEKEDSEFYVDNKSTDGLTSSCKECKRIKRKAHYANNPQTGTEWDKKHPERARARKRKYLSTVHADITKE